LKRQLLEKTSETSCVQKHIGELGQTYEQELTDAKAEINHLKDRIRLMTQKLERLPSLERFVRDMYLEFRDRPDDEGPAEEVARMLAKDKASIGSRTVMENLDYLRTDLRSIFARQADKDAELQKQMQSMREKLARANAQNSSAHGTLLQENAQALQKKDEAVKQLKTKIEEKEQLAMDRNAQLEALKKQVAALNTTIEEERREVQHLKDTLEHRDELLMGKEFRLVRVSGLEQQIEKESRRHRLETENLKAQSLKHSQKLEKESLTFLKAQQENQELQRELKKLRKELHDAKTSVNWCSTVSSERKAQAAEARVAQLQKDCEGLEEQVAKLRSRNALSLDEIEDPVTLSDLSISRDDRWAHKSRATSKQWTEIINQLRTLVQSGVAGKETELTAMITAMEELKDASVSEAETPTRLPPSPAASTAPRSRTVIRRLTRPQSANK
jgi:uncharacterized phage infection (PIP) family protein YhgE